MIALCCLARSKEKRKSENFIAFCCTDADDDVTSRYINLIRLCASFVLVDIDGGGADAIYWRTKHRVKTIVKLHKLKLRL